MWRDWRPSVVAADLDTLRRGGVELLRVFPLWPDFQPIHLLRGGHGAPAEYRFGETPLPDDELGRAGLARQSMNRFLALADLAAARNLRLVVGLLTGWMSGRLFVPPALEGRNPITDPVAMQWGLRFARAFVRHTLAHPAIAAWDLGNECNCMGAAGAEQAWVWTAALADAIRAADPCRPILSGMHSLAVPAEAPWSIRHQAENTDILTTHPYPPFTPHCDQEPITSFRPSHHAAAESSLYADLGGRPCVVEEIGTLGPMFGNEDAAAGFLRTVLFSAWAHDCRALLWWCAFDQLHLEQAPYDWQSVERELGLFRGNRRAKPVAREMAAFGRMLRRLPVPSLPPRLVDAVCLLSRDQDHWGVGFTAFLLAKQAGFDVRFADADAPLPPAPLYLLPALRGSRSMTRRRWLELLARVRGGATLYLSLDDALLPQFEALTGLDLVSRERRAAPARVVFAGGPHAPRFPCAAPLRLRLRPTRARVLAAESDGNPVFTEAPLGRGRVFLFTCPLERVLCTTPGVFHGPDLSPAWQVYDRLRAGIPSARVVAKTGAALSLSITEHPLNDAERLVVLINHGAAALAVTLHVGAPWRLERVLRGHAAQRSSRLTVRFPANDAVLLHLRRR
jgi:hypothetical protein